MLNRKQQQPQSTIQKFTHIHPFYALITVIAGPVMTIGLAPEFAPLLLVSFLFAKELVKEFGDVRNPARKTKSLFEEKEFTIDQIPAGKITHYGSQPVVEVYAGGLLGSLTESTLLTPYFLEFYIKYLNYLFMAVYTVYGAWSLDPGRAAIKYIINENDRRGLNFDAVNADIYYMCKETLKKLKQNNQTEPFCLQISEDEFDVCCFEAVAGLCEEAKGLGAEGCSTAVLPLAQGVQGLSSNLDWFNLFGVFHLFLINRMRTTPHFQETKEHGGKPEMTFASTIPGIIPAITVFNNRMLVVVYNEVGAKKGNRQNGLNAWPGMILAKKIAEECSTMAEVVALLKENQPASTCHLTIAARDMHGVLQCMQYGSDQPFDMVDEDACVATNHFFNAKGRHFMRESAPIPDSKIRYDQMKSEVKKQLLQLQEQHKASMTESVLEAVFERLRQIAVKPTTQHDTIKTILAWLNHSENRCIVRMNTANFNASFAPDETGKLHYDTFDLTLRFEAFRKEVNRFSQDYKQSAGPEKKKLKAQCAVDQSMIDLLQTAQQVGPKYPELAMELRHLCTALIHELAKAELSSPGLLPKTVQNIAMKTVTIVNIMLDDKSKSKADRWIRYKNWLQQKLPKTIMSYNPAKIPDALFRIVMCLCMDATLKYLAEKSPSMNFASSSYTAFIATLWEAIPKYGITFATSAYLVSQSIFKKPLLKASTEKIVNILQKELPKENRPSIVHRFCLSR